MARKKHANAVIPQPSMGVLDQAILAAEKQFGKGIVTRLGSRPSLQVATFSTGSLRLDTALGIGGYPVGRTIEIFGPESSGKTTLSLHAISSIQQQGGDALIIDAEHALDPKYAQALGVDLNRLMICQPDYAEQALDVAEFLLRNAPLKLIVVDSVAALVPKAEIEGEMGDFQIGLQARVLTKAMRKLTALASQQACTIIFINQLRTKIGVMFGNPETTPGGRALKFFASMRLELKKTSSIKVDNEQIGHMLRVRVVKNKLAPPFKECELQITFGRGIDKYAEVLALGVEQDIIKKSGAHYTYKDQKIAVGQQKAIAELSSNKDLFNAIYTELKNKLRPETTNVIGKALPASL